MEFISNLNLLSFSYIQPLQSNRSSCALANNTLILFQFRLYPLNIKSAVKHFQHVDVYVFKHELKLEQQQPTFQDFESLLKVITLTVMVIIVSFAKYKFVYHGSVQATNQDNEKIKIK
uniref:Uncharacterized protein n=1 Tax=Glossina austeni TaxID=7395 RepID=A0A1A9UGC2_GLOAU